MEAGLRWRSNISSFDVQGPPEPRRPDAEAEKSRKANQQPKQKNHPPTIPRQNLESKGKRERETKGGGWRASVIPGMQTLATSTRYIGYIAKPFVNSKLYY